MLYPPRPWTREEVKSLAAALVLTGICLAIWAGIIALGLLLWHFIAPVVS